MPRGVCSHLRPVGGQIPKLDHAHLASQAQHLKEERPKRRQVDLAEIADGAEVRRIIADDGPKSQIALAGSRDLTAGADAHGVGVDQERHHHGNVERRLATQFPGVILVEGHEIDLRDEIQQKEHQIVLGQRVARRNWLMASLLSVPCAVVLASIVHDLPPALCIKPFESRGITIVPAPTQPVQTDRSSVCLGREYADRLLDARS